MTKLEGKQHAHLDWLFSPEGNDLPQDEYTPHSDQIYSSVLVSKCPDSFELKPVKEWKEAAPSPVPEGKPTKPFRCSKIFKGVDRHALQVAQDDQESFRDLMWQLIFARPITHDLEKVRAVFVWLCSKNVETIKFGDKVLEGSPEEILKDLNGGKTTMATAFDLLIRNAGVESKRIVGYAKTGPSRPGERNKHVWNAVKVGDQWGFIEVMWAATKLKKQTVTEEKLEKDLDEFYFFTPPHEFVFTHLPEEESWQLLKTPLSLEDFESIVHLKSSFCRMGLRIIDRREGIIKCGSDLTMSVAAPKDKTMSFIFKLATSEGKEDHEGTPLNHYVMQQSADLITSYTFRLPAKGSYIFTIFAKDLGSGRKDENFGGVAIYLIDCDGDEAEFSKVVPYPPCTHSRYGPTEKAAQYGVSPITKGYIVHTKQGKAELQFKLPEERELSFMAKLKAQGKDEKELARYAMCRTVDGKAIFNILAPSVGEFGVEIYGRDLKTDGTSLFHIYQYLVICEELRDGKPCDPLPVISASYLGPQASYPSLGLTAVSHTDPYIEVDAGDMDVVFSQSKPLRMSSQLIYVTGEETADNSEYILQQKQDDKVIFKVRMCKTGLYKLQLFALPVEETSESLPGVYNYLISCSQASDITSPYPKQYSPWKEGCFLHEPLDGKLVADPDNKPLKFKIDVKKTNAISVVIGKDWTPLAMNPSGCWEGEVNMEKHWGGTETKLKVCAKLEGGENYSILLEYSIN